jgi:vitamin K-dependent gamma-carboxylase
MSGYSMNNLAQHWVFDPFKYFLTLDQITLFVVHHGGLIIDLFSGYLLFFDSTRIIGTLMTSSFHIMNSRMFNIGMFPYAMLATTTIFYSNDWPKRLFVRSKNLHKYLDSSSKFFISKLSSHCIYDKIDDKMKDLNKKEEFPSKNKKVVLI